MCGCHIDNKKEKCKYKRHKFSITENNAEKYNWAIKYIKEELETGRHIIACLGSAGYTFCDDINFLANYAYSIGDKEFYQLIINQ